MAADRHIQIGHDAQGNVLVTGDDNRVYVFPGITELTPELLAQLQSGAHTLQDAPGAVPLPLLTLRISAHDTASTTWTVTSLYPEGEREPRLVSTPGRRIRGSPLRCRAFGISAGAQLRTRLRRTPSRPTPWCWVKP